jgi:hypothetical protein
MRLIRQLFLFQQISIMSKTPFTFLTQQQSKDIDEELFHDYKFSVDQLMELAGLSCAMAIGQSFDERAPSNIISIFLQSRPMATRANIRNVWSSLAVATTAVTVSFVLDI